MCSAPLLCVPLVPGFLNRLYFFLQHNFLFHFPLHTRIAPSVLRRQRLLTTVLLTARPCPLMKSVLYYEEYAFPCYDKSCEQQG